MKKSTSLILVFLITALFTVNASGQSIFSINYIGEHRMRGGGRSAALGYSALAVPDSNTALTMNAATMSQLSRITFSLSQNVSFAEAVYGINKSYQNRYQLPSAILAAPVMDGLVLSVGYRTRFEGSADFSVPGSVQAPDYISVPSLARDYQLDSSLYTVPFGVSWRIHDRLMVGGELQIERGSIRDGIDVVFDNEDYGVSFSERKRIFSATSWSFSFLAKVHARLFLAGVVDGEVDYSVEEYVDNSGGRFDSSDSWRFSLPPSFSGGIYAGLSKRIWFSSSFWTREAPEARGFEQFEGALGRETVLSFGLERKAGGRNSSFFSRIPLRLGYYENLWHIEVPRGEDLKSRFITLGSAIDLPGGPGSLDYALEFGKIGSSGKNGIEEKVMRVSISISVSEAWKKRKIERH